MDFKNRRNTGLVLVAWILTLNIFMSVQAEDGQGSLKITANNTTEPISINSSDWLELKVSAFPERYTGINSDWWLYAISPQTVYTYDIFNGWVKGRGKVAYQGGLVDVFDYNVFSDNGLPDGAYKIFFGVDINMDGQKDRGWVFSTSKVNVNSVKVADKIILENADIYNIMKQVYLWNTEIPVIDTTRYATSEQLLSHLMYDQRDRWSFFISNEDYNNFFEEGKFIGLGFSMISADDSGASLISNVIEGSPASQAGLMRGYKIISINGKSIAEIESEELWEDVFGKEEIGVVVLMRVQNLQGVEQNIRLVKDWVTRKSVEQYFVEESDENPGKKIGYLFFSTFIGPSFEELKEAFSYFKQEEVTDLVLDLRYNGGGRGDVAGYLASLIKGDYQERQVFDYILHNTDRQVEDRADYFSEQPESINLKKIVVITSNLTCSASELIINGLRPYIEVVTVGKQTCGKPVGMEPWQNEENVFFPVSFRIVNVNGEGDYYAGIAPTCDAEDELTEALGNPAEASFKEALYVINNGECSGNKGRLRKKIHVKKEMALKGFRAEIGAF